MLFILTDVDVPYSEDFHSAATNTTDFRLLQMIDKSLLLPA